MGILILLAIYFLVQFGVLPAIIWTVAWHVVLAYWALIIIAIIGYIIFLKWLYK